jgi:2-alkenal reductase
MIVGGALVGGALAGALAGYAVVSTRMPSLVAPSAALTPGQARLTKSASSFTGEADDTLAAVRATRPAVVTIWNIGYVKPSFFQPAELRVVSTGSGVIFDERGYIATNAHVVQGAQRLEVVFLNGKRVDAEIVGVNEGYEVAVLRVDAELPAVAPLADSALLEPGMRVLAIGSPLGTKYMNTVTTGIIAGLNRRVTERYIQWFTHEEVEVDLIDAPLIQTDAAINSGNSGGPLVNMRGEVVALNTLIVRRDRRNAAVEGLGFAVPSNVVRALADEWIDGIDRGWIGFEFETLDPVMASERNLDLGSGALVTRVWSGVSAQRAGVQVDDIITAIDGVPLDLDHALADQLWRYRAGDTLTLTVYRDGRTQDVTVTMEKAPKAEDGTLLP